MIKDKEQLYVVTVPLFLRKYKELASMPYMKGSAARRLHSLLKGLEVKEPVAATTTTPTIPEPSIASLFLSEEVLKQFWKDQIAASNTDLHYKDEEDEVEEPDIDYTDNTVLEDLANRKYSEEMELEERIKVLREQRRLLIELQNANDLSSHLVEKYLHKIAEL